MTFAPGYLAEHPLPPGIAGALSLSGYQLLVDVAGVQTSQALLPEAPPVVPDVYSVPLM